MFCLPGMHELYRCMPDLCLPIHPEVELHGDG